MKQMQAYRAPSTQQYSVVLGPCPGCDSWQLDYTDEVAQQFVRLVFDLNEPLQTKIDMEPWHEVIEDALREHMAECPHLRDLVEAYV